MILAYLGFVVSFLQGVWGMNTHARERDDLRKALEASRAKVNAATVDFLKGARHQIHASHKLSEVSRENRQSPRIYPIVYEALKKA